MKNLHLKCLVLETLQKYFQAFSWNQDKDSQGIHYKTLGIYNLRKMDNFCRRLVSFLLPVTNTVAWPNTLAYYRVNILRIRNVLIVQAIEASAATINSKL
jgi:hypothetical protein